MARLREEVTTLSLELKKRDQAVQDLTSRYAFQLARIVWTLFSGPPNVQMRLYYSCRTGNISRVALDHTCSLRPGRRTPTLRFVICVNSKNHIAKLQEVLAVKDQRIKKLEEAMTLLARDVARAKEAVAVFANRIMLVE